MANLLLVDDERELLEALELVLEAEGHQMRSFNSARMALNILLTTDGDQPDLIISDIVMPEMNGLELLKVVRDDLEYADLPVLFISASISPETEAQLAPMQYVSFLRKPFQIDELCSLVDSLCK